MHTCKSIVGFKIKSTIFPHKTFIVRWKIIISNGKKKQIYFTDMHHVLDDCHPYKSLLFYAKNATLKFIVKTFPRVHHFGGHEYCRFGQYLVQRELLVVVGIGEREQRRCLLYGVTRMPRINVG